MMVTDCMGVDWLGGKESQAFQTPAFDVSPVAFAVFIAPTPAMPPQKSKPLPRGPPPDDREFESSQFVSTTRLLI